MGNCLRSCYLFGKVTPKRNQYFTGRYNNASIDIEFENLIEDDEVQREHSVLTEDERNHLLNRRYTDLVQAQQQLDAKLDKELALEEENARLEEEAYQAARREAARAANQARALERQKQGSGKEQQRNGSAKSWLGADAGDWEIATEDDFETFLETVKAKSETVRASGFVIQPDSGWSNHKQSTISDDDSDVEWEADFVSADSTPEPIHVSPAKKPTTSTPSVASRVTPVSSSRSQPIRTGLPSHTRTNGSVVANGKLPHVQEREKEIVTTSPSSAKGKTATTETVKPKKSLDIDIDKFLEELDFET